MKLSLLNELRCPACGGAFRCETTEESAGEVKEGTLACTACAQSYPVTRFVPRLMKGYNYSDSWGVLWHRTAHLLRDSTTEVPFHYNCIHGEYRDDSPGVSEDGTSPFGFNWPKDLSGQKILEIGPGTGNFTEHLKDTGATLYCVDMSDAIDTFPEEWITQPNMHVVQADINTGVLPEQFFDRIWFFQVLQHTPSPKDTLKQVRPYLKPGGKLAVTCYPAGPFKYWLPYYITRLFPDKPSWKFIKATCPVMVPIKYKILKACYRAKLKPLAWGVRALLGVWDPRDIYFFTREGYYDNWLFGVLWNRNQDADELMDHTILNTFDTITPRYTNCVKDTATMQFWLDYAGYSSANIWRNGTRATAEA